MKYLRALVLVFIALAFIACFAKERQITVSTKNINTKKVFIAVTDRSGSVVETNIIEGDIKNRRVVEQFAENISKRPGYSFVSGQWNEFEQYLGIVNTPAGLLLIAIRDADSPSGGSENNTANILAEAKEAINKEPNDETDFKVSIDTAGTRVVISRYTGTRNAVVIPAIIQGLPVMEIGERAFYQLENITNVEIPEGVIIINQRAFAACRGLRSVTLPNTLLNIEEGAFSSCGSLADIKLPASITKIGDAAFASTGVTSLFSINWPDSFTTIGKDMFRDSKLSGSLIIPEGITRIESEAFRYCRNLTSITLPSTIRIIGNQAFSDNSSLTTVIIPEAVQNIRFEAAVLGHDSFKNSSKINFDSQMELKRVGYDAIHGWY